MDSWKGEFLMTNTKKKHGNKMKLLSAVGMLTVSAAMLVSSTFAWFSMNKTVTAQTMKMTVKSDSTYLLISGTNSTASAIQAENDGKGNTTVTWASTQNSLIPSDPATSAIASASLTTSGKNIDGDAITTAGVAVTDKATAAVETNWYTANALSVDAATIDSTTIRQLTAAKFSDYVIKETVYLTVAKGANAASSLTVKPTFAKEGDGKNEDLTAARILVATSNGGFITLDSSSSGTATAITGATGNITDSTVVTVDIYFYYDGDNTNVYTNNIADLTGTNMSLEFGVTPVTA
jgi:hypothetical protein